MRLQSLLILVLLLFAPSARATPNFPNAIKQHLSLQAAPPCSLCHTGGVTQRGTVTTPFGTAMRARGLVEFDEKSLIAALDTMERDAMDSDGDSIPDIDELRAGSDPNTPDENPDGGGAHAAPRDVPLTPTYGCGVARSPADSSGGAWVLLIAIAIAGRRTSRRLSCGR